jgi:hypothetical protein
MASLCLNATLLSCIGIQSEVRKQCVNVLKKHHNLFDAAIHRKRGGGENDWGSAEVFLDGAVESHQKGNIDTSSVPS